MKRHPALIPLSHDHHDALVVAQALILGQSPAPRSDWPTDRRTQVNRVITFFTHTLRWHFEVAQLLDEHDAIRSQVRELERDPTTALTVRLPALGRLLEAHVRREERVLFETMQREMQPDDLVALGTRLKRRIPEDGLCRVN